MKNIRTKDGVYEVDAYDNAGTCIVGGFDNRKTFYKDEYLKMTDTIEELCDEVVVEMRFTETGYIAHLNKNISELTSFVEYLKECIEATKQDEILNVYGAIWTDKGLIYVAKMNEDEKLVLI